MQHQLVLDWLKLAVLANNLESAVAIEHEPSRAAALQRVQDQLKLSFKPVMNPPPDVLLGCCEQLVYKIKVHRVGC
jgi:hypothetical protein